MDEDAVVMHLMDCVLPGGAGFPSARSTGMTGLLAHRLRQADPALPGRLLAAVVALGAMPGPAAWIEAAARIEALDPKLFSEFRKYAYLTYYEQPAVVDAIRALGFRYNASPLPDGYPEETFDPARDAPRHARGRWIDTGDVRPVDLTSLDLAGPDLESPDLGSLQ